MAWVKFHADHDFRPVAKPMSLRAYKSGMIQNVTRECFAAVVPAKAIPCDRPAGPVVIKGGFRHGGR